MRSHGIANSITERGVDLFCLTRPGFPYGLDRHQAGKDRLLLEDMVERVDYHRIVASLQSDLPRHSCDINLHVPIPYFERVGNAFVRKFAEVRPSCVVAASNFVVAGTCKVLRGNWKST